MKAIELAIKAMSDDRNAWIEHDDLQELLALYPTKPLTTPGINIYPQLMGRPLIPFEDGYLWFNKCDFCKQESSKFIVDRYCANCGAPLDRMIPND